MPIYRCSYLFPCNHNKNHQVHMIYNRRNRYHLIGYIEKRYYYDFSDDGWECSFRIWCPVCTELTFMFNKMSLKCSEPMNMDEDTSIEYYNSDIV